MIKQVNFYTLLNELKNSDSCKDYFSRLGIIALYDYLEELEEVLTQAETIRKGASQDEVDQMVKTMRQLRLSIRKKAV